MNSSGDRAQSGWARIERLGDVANLSWGDTSTTKASYVQSGYVAYSASGPDGFLPHADHDRIAVVLSAIGADCGKTWLAKGQWSCIKNTIRFWASDPNVDTEYLYWLTRDVAFWPKRGSAQPFISQGDARSTLVSLPSLPEQRAIASVLGALDAKIELNRKMSATLEAMARALFKSWFVDFDPVRAKAEGRDPGLPADIAALFPDSFEDSELGEIPKGWRAGAAADLFSLQGGYAFRSKDWVESGVPVIKIASVKPGVVDLSNVSYVSEEIGKRAKRFRLGVGDIVIGMTGYVGEVGLVPPTLNPPLLNQRVGRIISRDSSHSFAPFAYSFFRLPETKDVVGKKAHGSAQPNVGAGEILSVPIVIPEDVAIDRYCDICGPIVARILSGYGEISTLSSLRDALLPKLISGEIRVGDAERLVGQSA